MLSKLPKITNILYLSFMLYYREQSSIVESELDLIPKGAICQLNKLGKIILLLNFDFLNYKTGVHTPLARFVARSKWNDI